MTHEPAGGDHGIQAQIRALAERIQQLETRVLALDQQREIEQEVFQSNEAMRTDADVTREQNEATRRADDRSRSNEVMYRDRAETHRREAEELRAVAEEARRVAEEARREAATLRDEVRRQELIVAQIRGAVESFDRESRSGGKGAGQAE